MNSPILVWKELASELGCELGVDTSRDYETVTSRFEHEGESFLTITLPSFRKAFERSLAMERWDTQSCTSFKMYMGLPRFLGGFLELVFDRGSGVILDKPNPDAVRYFRQLTGMFGSLFPDQGSSADIIGCSESRVKAAFEHFIETDLEVALHADSLTEINIREFRRAVDVIFGHILSKVDADTGLSRLRPRHSGGATAERLKGNQKWTFPEWTDRLEEIFPYLENSIYSPAHISYRLDRDGQGLLATFRSPGDELPVRVIAVPKTCEKPRIISIEPSYMQYMQQAIARALDLYMRKDLQTLQVIKLHDRTHNQSAAMLGSIDGSLATLDLRDASDRLSWRLVREGFASWPWLVRGMDATRSRTANVTGAGVIHLAKFASMGSALTFPIQTITFTVISFMGIAEKHGITVRQAFARFAHQVRVFGDDIIVPADTVPNVVQKLELYGFELNANKSFWTGRFRESCGGDYFAGEDVSYVKVRRHFPNDRNDVDRIVSLVALRNRFYFYGYWKTASMLDETLFTLLRLYPAISSTSSLLGHVTYLQPEGLESDLKLQKPVTTGFEVVETVPVNAIGDVDALTRYFFEKDDEDGSDNLHHLDAEMPQVDRFDRSGRPTRATLKRRKRPF